jgi:hypothetical protein
LRAAANGTQPSTSACDSADNGVSAAILHGARGKPPADIDALAEALCRLSRFAAAQTGRFTSIEINPLLVSESLLSTRSY